MDELDERQAAQALETVRTHQERAERAARVPWWAYVAMFLLVVAVSAANDFVSLSGAKLMAMGVLVLLVVVMVASILGRTSLLSRARGVQPRQTFVPWVFGVAILVGGIAFRLATHFGPGLGRAVGLPDYPGTVFGVAFGAVFTGLFALGQSLLRRAQPRTGR